MRIKIISVGRERADTVVAQTTHYLSRVQKFLPVSSTVIKPASHSKILERMTKETARSDRVLAMDERGKMMSSDEFAGLMESWMNEGVGEVTFVIGGADGLPREIREGANRVLSLSKMTFPHRLAKLFLAEQLYRALCQIRNIPYRK